MRVRRASGRRPGTKAQEEPVADPLMSAGEERRPPRLLLGSANDRPKGNDHPNTRQHEAIAHSHDMSAADAIREALEQYITARQSGSSSKSDWRVVWRTTARFSTG
jgi:hypothetical protein